MDLCECNTVNDCLSHKILMSERKKLVSEQCSELTHKGLLMCQQNNCAFTTITSLLAIENKAQQDIGDRLQVKSLFHLRRIPTNIFTNDSDTSMYQDSHLLFKSIIRNHDDTKSSFWHHSTIQHTCPEGVDILPGLSLRNLSLSFFCAILNFLLETKKYVTSVLKI